MSTGGPHEIDPDRAALDELMRAFGEDPRADELDDGPADELDDALDDALDDEPADELDDVTDDERIDAMLDADPSPRIIRIDDYSGSTASEIAPPDPSLRPPPAAADEGDASDRIVIDLDDDIPDSVYVEGSLDRDGKRSIVFIEDDDTGDAVAPESDRDIRRGIEPRMRERRVAVKRAQGRKRLKWVALGVGVLLLVVAALAVLGSPLFAVREDQLTITGNVYTDPEQLDAVVDDLVGTPVLLVDTQRLERELERIAWVDAARVRVGFPHAATIEIRERRPIATYQGPDGRFRVLDSDGRVLDVLPGRPVAYVLLGGPDAVDLSPGQFAPKGYVAAADLAKNLTGSVRSRHPWIDVTSDGSRLVMYLDDGTEVRFGEARDLFVKLVRLETVLTTPAPPDGGDDGGDDGGGEPRVIDVSTREVTQ